MKTRDEHLEWCKQRAREYLDHGDWMKAYTSMASDMTKHPETADDPAITLGVQLMMIGSINDVASARRFIDGFH